jgi:predicted nuclease with TOPRIM domain
MSADRTTEILNYLSAISREIGTFRAETNARLTTLETDMQEVRSEMKDVRTKMNDVRSEMKAVRGEMRGLSERFDGRFDRLMKVFLDFRIRTSDLEQRVHALDGKHPDVDPY